MSALYYKVKGFINEKKENLCLTTCEGVLTVWISAYAILQFFSKHLVYLATSLISH